MDQKSKDHILAFVSNLLDKENVECNWIIERCPKSRLIQVGETTWEHPSNQQVFTTITITYPCSNKKTD